MDCSTPGFPVHYQLLGMTQTHVHQVDDAIQPSHPLSSLILMPSIFPSNRVFQMGQFFASGGQNTGVSASVLQWVRTDFLQDELVGSPCSPRDSQESSPTPQFKSINSSVLSCLYDPTLTSIHAYLALTRWNFVNKAMSLLFNMLSRLVIAFLPRSF